MLQQYVPNFRLTFTCNSQDRDPACHNPDFVDPENLANAKKRKGAAAQEGVRKRVDSRSANEKRLEGDYEDPPNAVYFGKPGQLIERTDEAGEDRGTDTGNKMFGRQPRAVAGGWKFGNTLDRASPHAVKSVNQTHSRRRESDVVNRTYVNAPAGGNGDGFGRGERGPPATKKRRTDGGQQRDLRNDPIEVGDDDDDLSIPKVVGVNGREIKQTVKDFRAQRMAPSQARTKPFEGNEHKSLDQYTQAERPKPERKHPKGTESSQASSRASPVPPVNDRSGRSAADPVEIEDTSQDISQTHAPPPSASASNGLPDPKAIMNGVNDINESSHRRRSDASVEFAYTRKTTQMPPPKAKNGHAHPPQQQADQRSSRRTILQDTPGAEQKIRRKDPPDVMQGYLHEKEKRDKAKHAVQEQPPEESKLRQRFVRDETGPRQAANGKPRQRESMKAASSSAGGQVNHIRDSTGSVDELAGPTTIGSVSPEKQHLRATESRATASRSRTSRSSSESDLRPTNFTQGGQTRSTGHEKASNRRKGHLELDNRDEIPLANFFATSCVLLDGMIVLRYDSDEDTLEVYQDGYVQVVHGGKCTVHISKREVSSVIWSKDSDFILLKGPSNARGVSNGEICFQLQNINDKGWLADRIAAVAGDAVSYRNEDADRMKSTFANKADTLFKLEAKRRAAIAEEKVYLRDAQERRRAKKSHAEHGIQYDDEQLTKSSQRRGMQGERILDGEMRLSRARSSSQSFEQSPFFQNNGLRRTTRQTKPVKRETPPPPEPEKWTKTNKPARWPHSVVYPDQGPRRVTVDFQDLERLDEGEFLNDNVISFALRRIEEQMAPEHKEKVHFFNSFFYTALTTKSGKKAFDYDAVKRWTKSKDLLGCDYVVVPINIDLHWFVAIICNLPNLSRRAALDEEDEETKVEEGTVESGPEPPSSDAIEPTVGTDAGQSPGETSEGTKAMRNLSLTDDEGKEKAVPQDVDDARAIAKEAQASDHAEASPATKKAAASAGRKGKKRGPPSYDRDKPAIITLDSFAAPHTTEIRNLKEYLVKEAEAKRGMAVDPTEIQGLNAKDSGIPTQTNFCDCGVFLVRYVEQFAKNPREFATKALTRTLGQEGEFDGFNPSQKRDQIRGELLELQPKQEAEHKAKKAGKKAAAPKADGQTSESAAATPKPESKPASKAASPAKDTVEQTAVHSEQLPRQKTPSRKPAEETEAPAQPEPSQGRDLEFEVPRALHSPSRQAQRRSQSAGPFEEGSSQEMLDEPAGPTAPRQFSVEREMVPNPLLDNLSAELRRNSQQQEPGSSQVEQQQPTVEEQEAEIDQSSLEEEEEALDDGPDVYGVENVIDLGDEGDEADRSAEIPDSQERSQRQTGKWAGTRIVF